MKNISKTPEYGFRDPEERLRNSLVDSTWKDDVLAIQIHFSNLYDQDEDASGELYDLASGDPYDNSTYSGAESLSEVLVAEEIVLDEIEQIAHDLRVAEAEEADKFIESELSS